MEANMKTLLALTTAAVITSLSVVTSAAEGDADILFVSSGSAEVGDEVTVTLGVSKTVGAPNGGWSIDISYDNAVLSAVDCEPLHGSTCSPAFMDDTFRATGASLVAIEAPMDFARLTFRCGRAGVSPLNMEVNVWADATGFGEEIDLDEGSITCSDEQPPVADLVAPATPTPIIGLPNTGNGSANSTSPALAAALVALTALALLAVGSAAILSRRTPD
jgi:hypothetical protein